MLALAAAAAARPSTFTAAAFAHALRSAPALALALAPAATCALVSAFAVLVAGIRALGLATASLAVFPRKRPDATAISAPTGTQPAALRSHAAVTAAFISLATNPSAS